MTELDDQTYSAVVLDDRAPRDHEEIERLGETPGVAVHDLFSAQLTELRAVCGVDDAELSEPARWVYYPWRATMIRILGPRGYRRLRLDRNRNKIAAGEQERHAQRAVGVVGAAVGHSVALGLALEGLCGTLRIADSGTVGVSDLNHLPASALDHGLPRTTVTARRIAEIDPYLTVQTHPGVDLANAAAFVDGVDLVIDACDELGAKFAVREQARGHRVPVVMVTPDRGTVDVERFDLDPRRPLFHGLFAGFTAEAVAGLPAAAIVPFLPRMLGADGLSARMASSLLEIGEFVTTWPQLGGDALQAAACAVQAARRLGELASGRVHVDIAGRLDELADPAIPEELPAFEPVGDYRNLAEPTSDLEAIVRAGQLAPSDGNSQPWRFVCRDDAVHVELDEKRTSAVDIAFRASYLGIGAAVQNMRVAAAARGVLGEVELLPDESSAAVLRLGSGGDERLAAAHQPMLRRVTNRQAVEPDRPIPDDVLATLTGAATESGGGLAVLTGEAELGEAGRILASVDRLRYLLPDLHRDTVIELRDPRTDPIDRGVDVRSLELGVAAPMLGLIRRGDVMAALAATDTPHNRGAQARALVESYSALVAVTTAGGEAEDYLRGGQAMESVWIAATAAGLAVRPVAPLFLFTRDDAELAAIGGRYTDELADMRRDLRAVLGVQPGHEIAVVMLLGYASAPPTAISLRSEETARL